MPIPQSSSWTSSALISCSAQPTDLDPRRTGLLLPQGDGSQSARGLMSRARTMLVAKTPRTSRLSARAAFGPIPRADVI
jgi:hypothetical protein